MNPQEKSRGLIDKIVRRNMTSACMIFLEVLKEDSCYKELVSKIESTVVTQLDLELLRIGRFISTIFLRHNQTQTKHLCVYIFYFYC